MRIYKQVVPFNQITEIPNCDSVVRVSYQYGVPTVWFTEGSSAVILQWVWTGEYFEGKYLGTLTDDVLVYHLIQK